MLVQSSKKDPIGVVETVLKKVNKGSFAKFQSNGITATKHNNEDEGEVVEDSMEIQEIITLPNSTQSKSKERFVN